MLTIDVPEQEYFNEATSEITIVKGQKLQLEHSLISLSKWESKWEIPFLDKKDKTQEQMMDYIRCMTITQNVDPLVYQSLSVENIEAINKYINGKMTATWFSEEQKATPNRKVVTSEVIYYWMISLGIPVEFQKWHLNRLLTLIKVCNLENQPKKKMSQRQLARRNAALNSQRLKGR